ncbi:MAG: hypothetical protein J5757_09190 [Lachnospiraceae bacterium]|nr:hypothetical protein [Lachnospiraceae bacterium]
MTVHNIFKTARKHITMTISAVSLLILICGCASDNISDKTSDSTPIQSTDNFTASVSEQKTDEPAGETSTAAPGQQAPFEPNVFYGRLSQPFLILDSIVRTSETIELYGGTPYVKVECNVHYCNHPNSKLLSAEQLGYAERSAYDIDTFFIPLAIADEFTSHEMILLQVTPNVIYNNSPVYVALGDEKGNIGYMSFDEGKLHFQDPESGEAPQQEQTADQRVFQSIYDINSLVDYFNSMPPSHSDGRHAPMLKMYDGMTVQEVTDFFEAYIEWDEYLTEIYNNYSDAGIPVQ